jgi:mucin-19
MRTYKPIQSVVLTSTTTSVTFSGISQDYTDLVLVAKGSCNTGSYFTLRFNGDTTSSYSNTEMDGTGSAAYTNRNPANTYLYNASMFSTESHVINHIQNYYNNATHKTILARSNYSSSGVKASVGLWSKTAAITSIECGTGGSNTFSAGTTFDLYGIKAGSPKASGGQLFTDGNYWYHVFNQTQSFVTNQAITCDVLSVGGGGGGGWNNAGGGGGGEVDILNSLSIASGVTKTVTIGAGGATATSTSSAGANGVTTSFASDTTSLGGGGGGTGDASAGLQAGQTGGSGGGGALSSAGGSASGSNTNAGGAGYATGAGGGQYAGGGGGGATSAGTSANLGTLTSGAGGQGYALANIFSGLTLSGITHFGSGGSGGVYNGTRALGGTNAGNGAQDGGGNINPTTPTANAGGGGGGGAYVNVNSRQGSNGASGIVIVRYPV